MKITKENQFILCMKVIKSHGTNKQQKPSNGVWVSFWMMSDSYFLGIGDIYFEANRGSV